MLEKWHTRKSTKTKRNWAPASTNVPQTTSNEKSSDTEKLTWSKERKRKRSTILTLLKRKTRKGIPLKIVDYHSQAVLELLDSVLHEHSKLSKLITFDNDVKFSKAASLENEPLQTYFCYAHSSCEQGSNKLLCRKVCLFMNFRTCISKK